MVDYDKLLELANKAFPIGTEYTGLIEGKKQKSTRKAELKTSNTYECRGIDVGYDWIWLEKIGWCKEFTNQGEIDTSIDYNYLIPIINKLNL